MVCMLRSMYQAVVYVMFREVSVTLEKTSDTSRHGFGRVDCIKRRVCIPQLVTSDMVLLQSDSVRALSPQCHGNERLRVCSHHALHHNTTARIQICIELILTALCIVINSANSHIAKTCRFEWSDKRLYVLKQAITSFRSIVIFLPFVRTQLVTVFNVGSAQFLFAHGRGGCGAVEVKVKTRLRTRATQSDSD